METITVYINWKMGDIYINIYIIYFIYNYYNYIYT
jgi:hypothetical protein